MSAAVIRGGLWLSLSFLSGGFLRFVQLVFLSRMLTGEDFGKYQFFFSVVNLLSIFSLPEMEIAIVRSAAQGDDSFLISGIRQKIRTSLIGVLCLVTFAYMYRVEDLFYTSAIASCLFFPFYFGFTPVTSYFYGKENYRKGALFRVAIEVCRNGTFVALVALTQSLWLSMLGMMALVSFLHWKLYGIATDGLTPPIKKNENVRYGFHLTLISLPKYLFPHLDKLFVGLFLGYQAVSFYSCSMTLIYYFHDLSKRLVYLLIPKFSRIVWSDAQAIKRMLWALFACIVLLVWVSIALLPWLIPFLFSEAFRPAVPYCQWAMVSLCFSLPSMILVSFFQAQQGTTILYLYQYGVTVLFIGLLLFALKVGGLQEVIYGKIAAEACGLGYLLSLFLIKSRVPQVEKSGSVPSSLEPLPRLVPVDDEE